jgi:DNA topoisomerase-1
LFASVGLKVEKLAFNPSEMDLGNLRNLPESRICSAVGVDAMVVGLSVGDARRTYSNLPAAEQQAWRNCIIPMQKMHGRDLDVQLLPDFEPQAQDKGRKVDYDRKHVTALQQDASALRKDAALMYQAGLFTRAKALALAGEEFDAQSDRVYLYEAMAAAQGGMGGEQAPEPGGAHHFDAEAKFSASQPRDKNGMWMDTGGVGGSYLRHGIGTHEADDEERKARKVPPGWTDVQIANSADTPLQITGMDSKGREQSRYTAEHDQAQAAAKFERGRALADRMGSLEKQIDADALGQGKNREEANTLRLVQLTGFRIGSTKDTGAETQAFGASTLLKKHATIDGDTVTFEFWRKHGVPIKKSVTDSQLAREIESRKAGDRDRLFATTDAKVRKYLHALPGGAEFKVHDFRTWNGTSVALKVAAEMPAPTNAKEFSAAKLAVAKQVAAHLGNTPHVALKSYIAPHVFQHWETVLNTGA